MKVLDLFSGIGGFSLGLHRAGMETVAFCEIEKYPQQVLRKNFPGVPIYDDVRTVTAERLAADGIDTIDLICGGFPCQPFSVAGKQRGKDDDRHLWPEMFRIIQEVRPTWVIGENVAGFVSMALCEVSADLEGAGYEVQPFIIPACAVNAHHRRDRVWMVAYSINCSNSAQNRAVRKEDGIPSISGDKMESWLSTGTNRHDSHANSKRLEGGKKTGDACIGWEECNKFVTGLCFPGECWSVEPNVDRVVDGIPKRMDRLKGLGNAVVPQIPEIIGRAIMAASAQEENRE